MYVIYTDSMNKFSFLIGTLKFDCETGLFDSLIGWSELWAIFSHSFYRSIVVEGAAFV